MNWRHYVGAARAVCSLAIDTIPRDLDAAGALVEGAGDLCTRAQSEAHAELYARGVEVFSFGEYFHDLRHAMMLVTALRADVEQLRRDRSRLQAERAATMN
jgi:hypothetical protein